MADAISRGPGTGGPARGYKWASFEAGNTVSTRHGAYAVLQLGPRVEELADSIRDVVPCYAASDESMVKLLALTYARLERAAAALARLDEIADEGGSPLAAYTSAEAAKFDRLREDARSWVRVARSLANDLGLSVTARARLGLDVARAEHELRLVDMYREDGDVA